MWDPAGESEEMAHKWLEADSFPEIETRIYETWTFMGVQVHDGY